MDLTQLESKLQQIRTNIPITDSSSTTTQYQQILQKKLTQYQMKMLLVIVKKLFLVGIIFNLSMRGDGKRKRRSFKHI